VKAEQVDVASLGPVPNATHADSADTARKAQTAIAAEHADDATTINGRGVGCASATREFAGACWDIQPSEAALTAPDAVDACAAVGGELPAGLALSQFGSLPGLAIHIDGEWTNQVWVSSETTHDVYVLTGAHHFIVRLPTEPHHFRCVTPLVH